MLFICVRRENQWINRFSLNNSPFNFSKISFNFNTVVISFPSEIFYGPEHGERIILFITVYDNDTPVAVVIEYLLAVTV